MDMVHLGSSGLRVSRLALGCMAFSDPRAGGHSWALGADASRAIVREALEAGITLFDTANVYGNGSGEEVLGALLKEMARREDVVIATKVGLRSRPGPYGVGLSRKAVLDELDASLRRLGTDHVDLYQIHRWDPTVPVEETMEVLHSTVRAGKVRYLGASSMYAWQFAKAQHVARSNGWTPFVSMQSHYNLLYREEEREMIPQCADQGVGVMAWSPLARGRLTRPWTQDRGDSSRSQSDRSLTVRYSEIDRPLVDLVGKVAARRGSSMAQVSLAWLLARPVTAIPVVGCTSAKHLAEAVDATRIELAPDELDDLTDAYPPHPLSGISDGVTSGTTDR
jgi:aryl-alcohol dehydrogenase-like predicted oxidoreductase